MKARSAIGKRNHEWGFIKSQEEKSRSRKKTLAGSLGMMDGDCDQLEVSGKLFIYPTVVTECFCMLGPEEKGVD